MAEWIVYFNGKLVPESETRVPLLTHGLHYGTGVFEGIRAYYDPSTGEVNLFRAREHYERMARNVKVLDLHLPHSPEELVDISAELIRRNGYASDVYVRPIAFKASNKVGVTLPKEESFAIVTVAMGRYLDTTKGLHCGVSSWRRIQDNAIPCRGKICGAYVNSALAAQEARDRGFDEAIFLNEDGHVAEGAAMNLFLVRQGRLVTPDVSDGILEGITRETIMTLARNSLAVATETRAVDRTELYVADEIFLCGTAAEVAPVTRVDGRTVGSGKPGRLTLRLQKIYDQVVHGRMSQYRHWLEPCRHPPAARGIGVA
jgi:branched-chain amino acid aminotransferase